MSSVRIRIDPMINQDSAAWTVTRIGPINKVVPSLKRRILLSIPNGEPVQFRPESIAAVYLIGIRAQKIKQKHSHIRV